MQEEKVMNELVSHIVQKTGLSEDKARGAAEAVITFLKTKLPGSVGAQLDNITHGEEGSETAGGVVEKVKEAVSGIFEKKTA
jgi:hypothetical protein